MFFLILECNRQYYVSKLYCLDKAEFCHNIEIEISLYLIPCGSYNSLAIALSTIKFNT
jgi:hypothetical protein